MGTRSLTVFRQTENGKNGEICVMYRQMDGYPSGHGADLKEFLADMYLVNGISLAEKRKISNGMNCLTAQVIAHFKEGPGGFYIMPAKTRNAWEEYIYTLYPIDELVGLKVEDVYRKEVIYNGPIHLWDIPKD